jgi:hypothetical protein
LCNCLIFFEKDGAKLDGRRRIFQGDYIKKLVADWDLKIVASYD